MAAPKPMAVEDDIASNIRISDLPSASTSSSAAQPPTQTKAKTPSGPSFTAPPKLEPFLLLAKSARGASAAKLVEQATAAPGVYVFGELLDLPYIRELASNESCSKQYRLLELFAFGTYRQYLDNKDAVPPLSEVQVTKLKQLSLLSLASDSRTLPYDLLSRELDITNQRQLEDLVIETIYAGLVQGRLDQRHARFSIDSVASRDVQPQSLQRLSVALAKWSDIIGGSIDMLDGRIQDTRAQESDTANRKTEQSRAVNELLQQLSNESTGNASSSSSSSSSFWRQTKGGFGNVLGGAGRQQQQQQQAGSGMDLDDAAPTSSPRKGGANQPSRSNRKRYRP